MSDRLFVSLDTDVESGWWNAPLHYRWEPHSASTSALVSDRHGNSLVQRCSCGAFGPSPWVFLDPPRYKPGVLRRRGWRFWRKEICDEA